MNLPQVQLTSLNPFFVVSHSQTAQQSKIEKKTRKIRIESEKRIHAESVPLN